MYQYRAEQEPEDTEKTKQIESEKKQKAEDKKKTQETEREKRSGKD